MNRAKVLILIKSLGLGGAERLLVDSLPFLDRARFDYHFAYIVPWKGLLAGEIAAAGFPVFCLGAPDAGAPDAGAPDAGAAIAHSDGVESAFTPPQSIRAASILPAAYRRLARLHGRLHFDLIHADLPTAGFLARVVGRRHGVAVIYTEHNMQERYHPATRAANRLTYRWNDHVFAVSDEVAASIRRSGLDRATQVTTLLNGVPVEQVQREAAHAGELRAELALPDHRPVVGTVAVFRRQKRLADWVEMASKVAQSRDDVLFLIVGDGPEMPLVQARIDALGVRERFRLPGFRQDGRRLLALMDVYVMSSEHEGLPIALLEAMALGKAVVSTPAGGVPEVVQHGEHGFLAPIGATEQLAAFVVRLLAEPQLRAEMGAQGARRVAESFHLRRRVQTIEARYAEVLAARGIVLPADQPGRES